MQNLASFKRILSSAKTQQIKVKSTFYNPENEIVRVNEFAPVSILQSNCFALLRADKSGKMIDSYSEYGKASTWSFDNGTAIKNFDNNCKIIYEFETPGFFGI